MGKFERYSSYLVRLGAAVPPPGCDAKLVKAKAAAWGRVQWWCLCQASHQPWTSAPRLTYVLQYCTHSYPISSETIFRAQYNKFYPVNPVPVQRPSIDSSKKLRIATLEFQTLRHQSGESPRPRVCQDHCAALCFPRHAGHNSRDVISGDETSLRRSACPSVSGRSLRQISERHTEKSGGSASGTE